MIKNIVISLLIVSNFKAYAQKQYHVLNWKTDVSLNTYLVQQMYRQYEQRRAIFNNALKSKIQAQAYIKGVRQRINTVVGRLPKKASLSLQITGEIKQPGYRIEKIVYQSFENHHVTASLYVPNGNGKFPAVLLFCGHEDSAKATESYQKTAILLARNGFVVFVIDPISQGERVQLTDENGSPLTRGATTEHTLLNLSSNLLGTSVAAFELLDNQCALDYLVTRKEVDSTKIGVVGNSGGAMQAIYFAAIDNRVKAIVPCSYLASRESTFATTGAADGCAQIPNEGAQLLEMSDYLIAAAPTPVLILAGRYDFIDYSATLRSFDDLKKIYHRLEASNKLALFTYDDGHGISKPKREKTVQWLRKCFYNDEKAIIEPELKVLSDKELFASEKEKVNLTYPKEVHVPSYNLQLFESYAKDREKFDKLSIAEKQLKMRQLLNIKKLNHADISIENVGEAQGKYASFKKVIVRKENEIPMPILIYYPQKPIKKVVILISDEGKDKLVDNLDLTGPYINQEDVALIFADLRGTGETSDKLEMNDPKYFSKDYRNAMLALHIGRPLLGQQTTDIQTILQYLAVNQKTSNASIQLNALGNIGVAALCAAFLNSTIATVNVSNCIGSYQDILKQPLAKNRYGLVVYQQLRHYDLPDLMRWIGADKVKFY